MAGVETVIGLAKSILQLVSTIQTLGENYYRADAAWTGLRLQMVYLDIGCKSLEATATRFGLSEHNDLMNFLRDAKSLLEQEETKLRNSTRGSGFWFKLRGTVFPSQIGRSIQSVVDALDNIPRMLEAQQAAKQLLQKEMMDRSHSLRVYLRPDSRYVPLEKTQSRVFQALEDPQGPAVVLLFGGPGKGKSTLAAHVALHYEEKANVPLHYEEKANEKRSLFEQVVYLECGPEADIAAKQLELLRLLDSDQGAFLQLEKDSGFKEQINRRLGGLLKDQRVLLILDDVWSLAKPEESQEDLLWEMVRLCGKNVKCLVTSQISDLCQNLRSIVSYEKIQIEDPQREEARRILASHIGLPDQQIPQHLQEIADQMIEKTGSNTLALVSLAKAIDCQRAEDRKEWESVFEDLYKSLGKREIPALHSGRKYHGNLWSSLKRGIGSLTDSALKLWILTSMCEGPSVPEGVVEFLYESIQEKSGSFSSSRQELERIELIKINERKEEDNGESRRSWALHSLHREYIGGHESLVKVAESLLSSLIGEGPCQNARDDNLSQSHGVETAVVTALCALYMVDAHAGKAAAKVGAPRENFNVLRRSAIEPIVGLLEGGSSKQQRIHAMQVFLEYICHRKLDDNGICQLLSLPGAALPVLKALEDIALVEESSLLGENTRGIMRTLVRFLGDESHKRSQEAASGTLLQFSYNMSHKAFIVSFPGVLDLLARVTRGEHVRNPKVQVNCVSILACLTYGDEDCTSKLIRHSGVLASLSRTLFIDSLLELRIIATGALTNVATTREGAAKVMQIEGLVEVLKAITNLTTLRLLTNLAFYFPEEIANLQGVPTRLAKLLHNPNEKVWKEALRGLWCLLRAEGSRGHVKAIEGLIEALVAKLVEDVPLGTQRTQEWASASLTYVDDVPLGTQGWARASLTNVDPAQENRTSVHSGLAWKQRGFANLKLGLYDEALEDLNMATHLRPTDLEVMRFLCVVKVKKGDFQGAMGLFKNLLTHSFDHLSYKEAH